MLIYKDLSQPCDCNKSKLKGGSKIPYEIVCNSSQSLTHNPSSSNSLTIWHPLGRFITEPLCQHIPARSKNLTLVSPRIARQLHYTIPQHRGHLAACSLLAWPCLPCAQRKFQSAGQIPSQARGSGDHTGVTVKWVHTCKRPRCMAPVPLCSGTKSAFYWEYLSPKTQSLNSKLPNPKPNCPCSRATLPPLLPCRAPRVQGGCQRQAQGPRKPGTWF